MLSKNQLKLITSLRLKKYRNKHELFVAEGVKIVNEFLAAGMVCEQLFCTDEFGYNFPPKELIRITDQELQKISSLKTPNKVLGIFKVPEIKKFDDQGLIIALDGINDPGNLGTIIRLCDWFGVRQILCSKDSVDCYNPKVVQATMGSLARVSVFYLELKSILTSTNLPVYGAVMNGNNVHETALEQEGILVLGNEANGLSKEVEEVVTHKITIPRFGAIQQTESLNVATAAAILLNEFRRV